MRSFLAHEIETNGEAETLVRWALKFTASKNFFLSQTQVDYHDIIGRTGRGHLRNFLAKVRTALWETYGEDEIYVSPDQGTAEMQIELLFPELDEEKSEAPHQSPFVSEQDAPLQAPPMAHALSSSEDADLAAASVQLLSPLLLQQLHPFVRKAAHRLNRQSKLQATPSKHAPSLRLSEQALNRASTE